MNRRRLEAEAIRDSILAVSGKLDRTMGGPSFQDFVVEKPEHSPHYEYDQHDPDDPTLAPASDLPVPRSFAAAAVHGDARLRRSVDGRGQAKRNDHAAAGAGAAEQPVHGRDGASTLPRASRRRRETSTADRPLRCGWRLAARRTPTNCKHLSPTPANTDWRMPAA